LIKGFDHLAAAVLTQDLTAHGGRKVVFPASDDDSAAVKVSTLTEKPGFAPIKPEGLSCRRGNSWAQLIFKDLIKFD